MSLSIELLIAVFVLAVAGLFWCGYEYRRRRNHKLEEPFENRYG